MLKLFKNNEYDNKDYTKGKVYKALQKDGIVITEQDIQKARVADPETLYKIGDIYYKKKNYKKAFAWFQKAALQGHSDSQAQVGWMYRWGEGVSKDYKQAMNWSMKAASAGNANGQCNIGELYYWGWGVSRDRKQAMDWYLKAANNANAGAMNQIGYMYLDGAGVTESIPTAIEWYTKSANQGDKWAQYHLGRIYRGEDEVKDLQKAVNWYQKAADNGNKYAKEDVKELNDQGYYAKDEEQENETIQDNNATDIIINDHSESSTTSNNDEQLNKAIGDKIKAIEKTSQSKMSLIEVNTDSLQKELAALKQEKLQQHEENMKLRDELAKLKAIKEDSTNNGLNYDSSNNANDRDNDINYDSESTNSEEGDENNATANKTIMEGNNDALPEELTALEQTQLEQHEESNQLSDKLTMLKAGTKDIINNDLNHNSSDSKHDSDNDINYDSESTSSEEEEEEEEEEGVNKDDNTASKHKESKLPEKELVRTEPVIQNDDYYDTSDDDNDNDFNYDTECSYGDEEEGENNNKAERNAIEGKNDQLQKELAVLKQKELEQDEENRLLKERLAKIEAGIQDDATNDINYDSTDNKSDNDINYDTEFSEEEEEEDDDEGNSTVATQKNKNQHSLAETSTDLNYDSSDNEDPRNDIYNR